MRVISNTSPILNLAIIGQLELLHQQFGELWIPHAVLEELRSDENLPGSSAIQDAIKTGWIKVENATDSALVQSLENNLDLGEAEAIALALQVQADWVLLDERDGRKQAKRLGLNVLGVLGVLLRARRDGQLDSLSQAIQDLQKQAAFRIAPNLLSEIESLPEYQHDSKRAKESSATYVTKQDKQTTHGKRRAARTMPGDVDAEPPKLTRVARTMLDDVDAEPLKLIRAARIMSIDGEAESPKPARRLRRTKD